MGYQKTGVAKGKRGDGITNGHALGCWGDGNPETRNIGRPGTLRHEDGGSRVVNTV